MNIYSLFYVYYELDCAQFGVRLSLTPFYIVKFLFIFWGLKPF